jgi:DNA repair photolyase|nr:radical SAM protein [Spirochaetaceae bacterium]
VEGDFEKDLIVRSNLPELLTGERRLLREKSFIGIGSGTTDAYQPLEQKYRITRGLLKEILQIGYPVSIATKNHRLLEDLPLLKAINEKAGVVVAVSFTTLDDSIRRHFEPGASSVDQRLHLISELKKAGIPCGVLAMPFLPGVSDDPENLNLLYAALKDLAVDFLIPGWLTLRPGRQMDLYMEKLKAFKPQCYSETQRIFSRQLPGGFPLPEYRRRQEKLYYPLMMQYQIPAQNHHAIYHGRINLCDEFFLLLLHMEELYRWRGVDVAPLKQARKAYIHWLDTLRRDYYRRRSLPPEYPELILRQIMQQPGELQKLLGNTRLADFLTRVARGEQTLEYFPNNSGKI